MDCWWNYTIYAIDVEELPTINVWTNRPSVEKRTNLAFPLGYKASPPSSFDVYKVNVEQALHLGDLRRSE